MKFQLQNGEMVLARQKNVLQDMRESFPLSTVYVVDVPTIKESIKNMDFLKGKAMSIAPIGMLALGVADVSTGGAGVFWSAFMKYIFPYLLDIAKVFCAVKIAQAFYEEKRGGREGGTGFGAVVTYGKWYLVFWLIPWFTELIDQIGGRMLHDIRTDGGSVGMIFNSLANMF